MLQDSDIDVDLITVFSLKKSPLCSPNISTIEQIQEYKYYWKFSNIFNMMSL